MADKMMDKSCAEFAAELAGKSSVPGGGATAAYMGALSAALCNMVGNFTIDKKKYADYEADMQRMLAEGEKVRTCLLVLVEQDCAAFSLLLQAYGIPKEDPTRVSMLEERTKGALAAPLEMMRQIARVIELLEEMHVKGSLLLASDVGCGAACAAAAMQAAALNVFVNTKVLQDRDYAAQVEAEADELLAFVPRAQKVVDGVAASLRA